MGVYRRSFEVPGVVLTRKQRWFKQRKIETRFRKKNQEREKWRRNQKDKLQVRKAKLTNWKQKKQKKRQSNVELARGMMIFAFSLPLFPLNWLNRKRIRRNDLRPVVLLCPIPSPQKVKPNIYKKSASKKKMKKTLVGRYPFETNEQPMYIKRSSVGWWRNGCQIRKWSFEHDHACT